MHERNDSPVAHMKNWNMLKCKIEQKIVSVLHEDQTIGSVGVQHTEM
jgi:hypothetical protein